MKAVGYCRVSTQEQAREGISLEMQKAKILSYASLKDLDLNEIIEDAGLSAKNLKRPGMRKILDMVEKREVDAVICYKLDRMFRSTTDALRVTKICDKKGVSFHSVQENIDTKSAIGGFFFTLMAAIAEMERKIIGERIADAWERKREKGEKGPGYEPYGFITSKGKLIRDNDEIALMGDIRAMRSEGSTLQTIADHLNQEGITTKTGKAWSPAHVFHVVNKEVSHAEGI